MKIGILVFKNYFIPIFTNFCSIVSTNANVITWIFPNIFFKVNFTLSFAGSLFLSFKKISHLLPPFSLLSRLLCTLARNLTSAARLTFSWHCVPASRPAARTCAAISATRCSCPPTGWRWHGFTRQETPLPLQGTRDFLCVCFVRNLGAGSSTVNSRIKAPSLLLPCDQMAPFPPLSLLRRAQQTPKLWHLCPPASVPRWQTNSGSSMRTSWPNTTPGRAEGKNVIDQRTRRSDGGNHELLFCTSLCTD